MNLQTLSRCSSFVGIDVGGANIKVANAAGKCAACRFPLWIDHERLGKKVGELLREFSDADRLAVTMTGELADCFATRREGVRRIIEQLTSAFPADRTSVYALNGQWFTPEQAIADPWQVAASNWHALATWTGRALRTFLATRSFLLVDVGSTTVDVIPIVDGVPRTLALTDRERLQNGQLVYTGVERTPVAAIVRSLTVASVDCPVMAERFATSDDVYLALGLAAQDPDDCQTADGRPRTVQCARSRLARMVGEDSETLSVSAIEQLARQVLDEQTRQIAAAVERNVPLISSNNSEEVAVLASGHGKPLLERVLSGISKPTRVVWLEDLLNPEAARCAPAVAVAWLLEKSASLEG